MNEKGPSIRRFKALHERLSRLLYDYDPDGMGSTVSAPVDEYDGVATSLIRALRDKDTSQDFDNAVLEVVPGATAELIREIESLWAELSIH